MILEVGAQTDKAYGRGKCEATRCACTLDAHNRFVHQIGVSSSNGCTQVTLQKSSINKRYRITISYLLREEFTRKITDPCLLNCLGRDTRLVKSAVHGIINVILEARVLFGTKIRVLLPDKVWVAGADELGNMAT